MPYRRLPNTDASRLKALKTAFEMGRALPPFKLAFSQSTLQRVRSFLPSFEKAMVESKQSYNQQVIKNKDYVKLLKRVKLYISHFIQVVNMAIARGELPPSERNYFSMDEDEKKAPLLNSEAEIIEWGQRIITGEELRRAKNRNLITNPTMAVVRVRYEQFIDSYKFQKTLQKNHQRALENLAGQRDTADDIILNVWNEVEAHFAERPDYEKREEAEKYGVAYVFRKSELIKQKAM